MSRLAVAFAVLLAVAAAAPSAAVAKVFTGKLEVRHTDDFRHGRGLTTFALRTESGKRLPLLPSKAPAVRSGTAVKVKGTRVGPWLEGRVRRRGGAPLRAATALGEHRLAVVLVNFTTDARTPWTPEYVEERVLTAADSTAAFYAEESYGAIDVTGDVLGWYTISAPTAGCDVDLWADQARAASSAAGNSVAAYDNVMYVFPRQSSCRWAGLGEVPGSQSWLNGTIAVDVAAHELGHNLGLHHASSYACSSGGTAVTLSTSCSASEYGDPYDVMGTNARRSHAWHLSRLGVLSGSDVKVASGSGTYTVRSAVTDGAGTALLRVPAGGTPTRYYDVSLRGSGGVFDDFLSSDPIVNGVQLHYNVAGGSPRQSLLLDATPGSSGGFTDSPLAAGRTFSAGDMSITVTSAASGAATVEVQMGVVPDTQDPSAPAAITATPGETSIALQWAAASDNVGVTGYRVFRDYALVGTSPTPSFADTGLLPNMTYRYQVEAFDAAGNTSLSQPVLVSTLRPPDPDPVEPPGDDDVTPPADERAPVVRIASPGREARLRKRATIVASATDNVRAERMELSIDGERVAEMRGSRLRRTWQLRGVSAGRHWIQVRAFDGAGNVGARVVRVRVTTAKSSRRGRRK
jgi:hypothetical protein